MKQVGPCLLYADETGKVFDFPGKEPLLRTGNRLVHADREELIPLPFGSYLHYLPGRRPVFYTRTDKQKITALARSPNGSSVYAVSAFLASGYVRTLLPGFERLPGAPVLPLWGYCGVVFLDDGFYVPAFRIDDDPRSDPAIHQDRDALGDAIREKETLFPANRLVRQLALCSTTYDCLCARNFFLGRFEAPVPTSPACNAGCLGCLSLQEEGSGFEASQARLTFKPTPEEIAEVVSHHFLHVTEPVASFGQGCEGEPLLRADDLVRAVRMVRAKTDRGTINLNTNGSDPSAVASLAEAGLDSIRISLNSPTETYYTRFHQPENYTYHDVLRSVSTALEKDIFVSINLFFMPGFTDMETEVASLFRFLDAYPVHMIQTRNMNIDPDFYFESIGFQESEPCGIRRLIDMIRERYPSLRIGYYNPPKESFL